MSYYLGLGASHSDRYFWIEDEDNESPADCSHCHETYTYGELKNAPWCNTSDWLCSECWIRSATPNTCDSCFQEVTL